MATPISQLKGSAAEIAGKIFGNAVLVWNETTKRFHGGDGTTAGGIPMAREDQKNDGSFGYMTEIKIDNYSVVAADTGKILLANKATAISFTLPPATTLGAKFVIAVKNIGAGVLSLVPDGTDQIDGLNTAFAVPSGASTMLKCDGASFRTVLSSAGITGEGLDPWSLVPLGIPVPADLGMTGFVAPPKNKHYRYIVLSAGETGLGAYNEGALTGESVSGSSPTISATATIALAGTQFNGATVRLINTTREILRPGSPGVLQLGQVALHNHGVNDPGHRHQNPTDISSGTGSVVREYGQGISNFKYYDTTTTTTGISIQNAGGDENRVRNIGANYYLRIK